MTGSPEANAANIGPAWVFAATDIPRLALPYRDGVVAYRMAPPRPGGEHTNAAENQPGTVDFIAVEIHEAARVALRYARQPGSGSVVVHPRFAPSARTALAIVFAAHLAGARRTDGLDPNVVTTACAPDLRRLPGHVRVPHLLTVSGASQENIERTIWEIMSVDAYRAWLGGKFPDAHDVVEAHLPGLLALRQMLRRHESCEHLPNGRRIREVLADADDNLTIHRVYCDPDVFLPAAADAAGIPGTAAAGPPDCTAG